jgi:hypothetical protein
MLPRLLCEELCSLHPGYPRCAFSIVWELDEEGHIYGEWAGRSVISSRAKLAYPMVQQMIEGCFEPTAWGVQLHEGATWEQVRARVRVRASVRASVHACARACVRACVRRCAVVGSCVATRDTRTQNPSSRPRSSLTAWRCTASRAACVRRASGPARCA